MIMKESGSTENPLADGIMLSLVVAVSPFAVGNRKICY